MTQPKLKNENYDYSTIEKFYENYELKMRPNHSTDDDVDQ